MVNEQKLDQAFDALANQRRRAILQKLSQGPCTVRQLYVLFDTSKAAVSKHLARLESAGLIRRQVRGREHHIELASGGLDEAGEWFERNTRFWNHQIESLGKHLQQRLD